MSKCLNVPSSTLSGISPFSSFKFYTLLFFQNFRRSDLPTFELRSSLLGDLDKMSDNKAPGAQNDAANILATPPQTSARNTSKDTGDDLEPARKASTESTIKSSTMIPDINSVPNSSFLPERPAYIPIPAIAPHSSPATTRVASASAPYPIEKPAKFLSSTAVPREHAISPTSVAAAAASVISYIAGKEASPISARDVDIVGETEASATKGRR